MKDIQAIGTTISRIRRAKGLTQGQLATMLGVSHQAVSKWESGRALPDIAVLLELTKVFGITIESLIDDETHEKVSGTGTTTDTESTTKEIEVHNMKINELLQMAAFMTKEAVGEIAMKIEEKIDAGQLARLAPFVKPEILDALLEKHAPVLTWETLRKLAPFMTRERVDAIAREITEGSRTVENERDDFSKAMDEVGKTLDEIGKGIGKTFDDIGKGMGKTLDDIGKGVGETLGKVFKFGEGVINDIGEAISDLANDVDIEATADPRAERVRALRRRAFERALADGRFDWIADHLSEIEGDDDLCTRVVMEARRREMNDWVAAHMSNFVDAFSVDNALETGDWEFLADNAWKTDSDTQEKILKKAVETGNWEWLEEYTDVMDTGNYGLLLAEEAVKAGRTAFARQLCETKLDEEQIDELVRVACETGDPAALGALIALATEPTRAEIVTALAVAENWAAVEACIADCNGDIWEKVMETAVDQGNFEAVDMLEKYI